MAVVGEGLTVGPTVGTFVEGPFVGLIVGVPV